MPLWERLMNAGYAAAGAWKQYGAQPVIDDVNRYVDRWSWWDGSWRKAPTTRVQRADDPALYQHTRQLWRTADAIVSLYEQFVYSDTTEETVPGLVIPILPQTTNAQSDERLLLAFAELMTVWRWRQHMTLRPKFGAILGDGLTELFDDVEHGWVYPEPIWPGYVVDLKLNPVGDVKRYAVEWMVETKQSTAYGEPVKADRYKYRKEVDGTSIRHYRDDRPSDGPWGKALQPNPYGFVPAIWDRHEIVYGDRGESALSRTLASAKELNSILSSALDYQRKQFHAPVGVVDANITSRRGPVSMPRTKTDDPDADARTAAEQMGLLPMGKDGAFVTVQFDVGSTVEMLQLVIGSIVAEAPESRYGQQLLELQQATGPAVELILAPIVGKVRRARANYDPQTIKLLQMATSMIAMRVRNNEYDPLLMTQRATRYDAFRGFTEDSHDRGEQDATVDPDRPVFPESLTDKTNRMMLLESLTTEWAMEQAGMPPEEIAKVQADREEQRNEMAAAMSVAGAPASSASTTTTTTTAAPRRAGAGA